MLFRVKTQAHDIYKTYHFVPVGTILHHSNIVDEFKWAGHHTIEVGAPWFQIVPIACLERIPNTKANLRKFAKGLL